MGSITHNISTRVNVEEFPGEEREIVRCEACQLRQFRTVRGHCRKCTRLLSPKPITSVFEFAPLSAVPPETAEHESVPETLGDRVRHLREVLGFSQKEVYRRSGVSPASMSRIEKSGRMPQPETLEKIAHVLGVPVSYLVGHNL